MSEALVRHMAFNCEIPLTRVMSLLERLDVHKPNSNRFYTAVGGETFILSYREILAYKLAVIQAKQLFDFNCSITAVEYDRNFRKVYAK